MATDKKRGGGGKARKPTKRQTPSAQQAEAPAATAPDPSDPVLPAVNPVIDDHLTPKESLPFPIVAIGASAGGLEAISPLLGTLPTDTGMAFVVVQHLSPTHESVLPDILTRATALKVAPVYNNMPVEPDHVYVIPPGKDLVFGDGHLQLAPRTEVRGQQRPIDHFMRSLAEEHGHKSIGVVLSGTANDGSLGIQEIKAAGGITFAQDSTAEQQSMPRSAIATGAIDFVLAPTDIGRELARIARHPYVSPALDEGAISLDEQTMQKILGIVRQTTGVDFSGYKRNTLNRRIARRLLLHKLHNLQDYLRFLQTNGAEVEALFQDMLINVTSFFRNPEAYDALKTVVFPKLSQERNRHEPIRIWALGCSTGEEAYSIAMTFTEFREQSGQTLDAQIFATDLNGVGIDKARAGLYARGIVQDVAPDRLRRFFIEVDGSYRIAKPIRDMCVFARQNILADPPFSRLDLVACRNMLIYLEPNQQRRLIPMLHYSLRNHGYLWLGASETIGSYRELFDIVDTKHKIYAKKPAPTQAYVPVSGYRWEPHRQRIEPAVEPREPHGADSQKEADRVLLGLYAPPAVVLSEELDILHFRGDTGPFLVAPAGRATHNVLKMLREGLLVGVRSGLQRARKESVSVRVDGLRVRSNGGWRDVDVAIMPLKNRGTPNGASFVVAFEEPAANVAARARQLHEEALVSSQRAAARADSSEVDKENARVKQELAATRDYLQSVIEQQEAANEELQSANEEVQSANEELQSTNEELETSKEEIQSANEELATVNDELQNRNLELSQSNNDLTNLLASVQLAIVMLGPDLRIRRYTPAAEKLFNLIPGDVGRPLSDIKLSIATDELERLMQEVIQNVTVHEREVQDRGGRWYLMRLRPYRTVENHIDGVVLVMLDIHEQKNSEQALRESEARFEMLADHAPVLIWMSDLNGYRFVNKAFEEFVGESESEIRGLNINAFIHRDDRDAFDSAYREAEEGRRSFESRARFRRADGEFRWTKTVGIPRLQSDGHLIGYVGGTFDITDMKEAEAALLELDRGKNEFLAMLAHELRNPLAGVRNASRLLFDSKDEKVIARARDIIDRQTAHMVRMIDDLLDVSRVTQGKIRVRFERVNLDGVLRHSIDSTESDRKLRKQDLKVLLADGDTWVDGDPMRLEQIFVNLLSNASKFTPEGGRISIALGTEPGGNEDVQAVVRVTDNGAGIEPSALARVFDLFVQAERSMHRTGLGLGLTLARRLVVMHDGTIEAFSDGRNKGSEFVVRLPVRPPPGTASEQPDASQTAGANRRSVAIKRILVIDDDEDAAEGLKLLLEQSGHEVRVASDGEKGLELVRQFRPDSVLIDIDLPKMDGYAVAEALRSRPETRHALLIAVTGFGADGDIRKSRDAGFDDHLTKPVNLDQLLMRIEQNS
ncbi:MAG TPA: chemotaxis protein CheB [Casimicrobiaceae bacterium]|nr:chemotaxis protein CheB [Casimicrobiaceae bacterium]